MKSCLRKGKHYRFLLSQACVFTLFVYTTSIPLLGCYDADIDAGYDPPKFEDELLSVRRGKIPGDAGLFHAEYEEEEENGFEE